jgi:hypothetical protein
MDHPSTTPHVWTLVILIFLAGVASAQPSLQKAISHNDYLQRRPLLDALDEGYVNIEADIFLHHEELVVAHWFPYGKKNTTLEKLYLLPLAEHIQRLQASGKAITPFTLLIDIKSSPESTYLALKKVLEKYRWMLSSFRSNIYLPGLVTVVLTGRKPDLLISRETERLVIMDDFLNKPSRLSIQKLYAMASCKYSWIIGSKDSLTCKEKTKVRSLVELAHSQGKKARLWASPESDRIRRDLLDCGIDLINTDHLKDLKRFLSGTEPQPIILARSGQLQHCPIHLSNNN